MTKIKSFFNQLKNNPFQAFVLLLCIIIFSAMAGIHGLKADKSVASSDKQTVYIFHSLSCPHCHDALKFIHSDLKKEFPKISFSEQEVSAPWHKTERELFLQYTQKFGARQVVPFVVIGNDYVQGFGNAETTGKEYRVLIEKMLSADLKKKL